MLRSLEHTWRQRLKFEFAAGEHHTRHFVGRKLLRIVRYERILQD